MLWLSEILVSSLMQTGKAMLPHKRRISAVMRDLLAVPCQVELLLFAWHLLYRKLSVSIQRTEKGQNNRRPQNQRRH